MHRPGSGLNLRRCANGHFVTTTTANNNTWALKNNTATSELILVWVLTQDSTNFGDVWNFSVQQNPTLLGTNTAKPMIPGDAPPPGQLGYFNNPTAFTSQWQIQAQAFVQMAPLFFPWFVLPPGWAFCIQDVTAVGGPIGASALWEAITPEEFEYLYGDTGLAVKRPAGAV